MVVAPEIFSSAIAPAGTMIIRFAQPDDFALIEPAIRFYRRLGGGFGATASETLFGEEIDVTSVERDDLVELSGQTSREAI